jgi:hypothetical protein
MGPMRKRVFAGFALLLGWATAAIGQMPREHGHGHGDHASAAIPAGAAPQSAVSAPSQRPGGKREWTRYPLLLPAMGGDGERNAARLRLVGIEAPELLVFASAGDEARRQVRVPVTGDGANFTAPDPKVGNYHWVIARGEQQQDGVSEVRVASTAWFFSNPGPAPTAMLRRRKNELEIVPDPLPREHNSYHESEKSNFLVRFNGAPLANQAVNLETEFGSRSTFFSDADGRVVVLFPRDFRPAPASSDTGGHDRGPRRAKFVLATERDEAGKHYLTALNLAYSADPERDRSVGLGAAFAALGMVAAVPLLRRRSAAKRGGEDNGNA